MGNWYIFKCEKCKNDVYSITKPNRNICSSCLRDEKKGK